MKYLSDQTWSEIPVNDFRPRFFVETYQEKLSIKTPHFSQSRLMNILSSCQELLTYIKEYESNDKNGGYIISALDEIESCLNTDPIAKKIFTHVEELRENLFKKIRGGDFSKSVLINISLICKSVTNKEEDYLNHLLDSLKTSIFGQADLNQVKRITSEIYQLTGLYTTYLLNKGYSPTYLFNRADLFTRTSNFSNKNFEEQFNTVVERLRSNKTKFEVFFSIRAHKASCLLEITDDADFKFFSEIPDSIRETEKEKLNKNFEPNVITRSEIESTDYVTASWLIKEKLDKLLDAVTALELNPRILVSDLCVTISRHQQLTHTKTLNISLLLQFLSSESGTYFSDTNTSIRHSLTKINMAGQEKLGRSLRYLRLARESVSTEQKLLNLWISLESLFSDGESSILSNILEYVPQIYAVSALERRVRYLRDLLITNQISITPMIAEKIGSTKDFFDKETTDSQIFAILRDSNIAKDLFQKIGTKEHLKFKFISTFDEFESNKKISNRINLSMKDVTRQLRRIYFLRNKIAHTGHYANIRPQLVTHLLDYLAVCYSSISKSAAITTAASNNSLTDMLSAYKIGTDIVLNRSKKEDLVVDFENLSPKPVI